MLRFRWAWWRVVWYSRFRGVVPWITYRNHLEAVYEARRRLEAGE